MALDAQTRTKITALLEQHKTVLFMKGTRRMPRCGFSATVVQILDGIGVDYQEVDVLADPAIRDGIKEFGNWPTIPQLYHQGSLVGGCDIVRELDQTGELAPTLGVKLEAVVPPQVQVTERAAAVIREAAAQAEPGQCVRIGVMQGGRTHEMTFDDRRPSDVVVEAGGLTLLFDRPSAKLAGGMRIDFVEGADGGGFQIDNPNGPAQVKALTARELKARMDAGEALHLYDVRPAPERAQASIQGAVPIHDNPQALAELEALPKDALLVFHCHHGMRSHAAAEGYLRKGFRNVYNLTGGIDAWSREVDTSVRRY